MGVLRLLYNLFFPAGILFFLPGLITKYRNRPGWKSTYAERFGRFSPERAAELEAFHGAVWVHAVSVGESVVALSAIKVWLKRDPSLKVVISTTTTTGQELVRKQLPERCTAIFCPIDFIFWVQKTFNLIRPSKLVIFETELWPNLVCMAKQNQVRTVLINTRISDKSFKGYRRFRKFFAPILRCFDAIGVQTETDRERLEVIAPDIKDRISVTGNIKFDQTPPPGPGFDLAPIFGTGHDGVFIGASTHSPEDALIIDSFRKVRETKKNAKLILVPRHAERGNEIEKLLEKTPFRYHRRSLGGTPEGELDVLLADTTGELASFIKSSDIVIMGKTFAGNDEGQSIIEPAVIGKAILTGPKLKNFRQALDALKKNHAVRIVEPDSALPRRSALGPRPRQEL